MNNIYDAQAICFMISVWDPWQQSPQGLAGTLAENHQYLVMLSHLFSSGFHAISHLMDLESRKNSQQNHIKIFISVPLDILVAMLV